MQTIIQFHFPPTVRLGEGNLVCLCNGLASLTLHFILHTVSQCAGEL